MNSHIVYDALFVGLQSGILLCLGVVMILAGKNREKYTRRIHLLSGLLCCLMVLEFMAPSIFIKETMDIYYRGISDTHTAKFSSIVVQAENILSYPLLAMVLFSLFQAFRPIPFRTILFPLVFPVALLTWTITSFDSELQTTACNIFWGIYVSFMIVSFISGIKGYGTYCKDNYSDTTGLSLKWLTGIPFILIPVIIFDRYVYSVHPGNLFLAIISEISMLPPIVYLVWFAHRQTPADECSGVVNDRDSADSDSNSRQLSADMIEKLSLLLETECIQSQAFLDPQLTRSKLAAALCTNSTYLSRYFAQNGTNFYEYINGLRLDYACRLIKGSNEECIALNQIAIDSGFASYRTFSRLFVNRFGVSPTDWRNGNIQKSVQINNIMKANKYIKAILTSLVCTVVAAVIMIVFQTIYNNNVENSLVDKSLIEIPAQLDSESQVREALIREYDRDFQTDLAAVRYLMETDGQKSTFERINAKGVSAEGFFLVRKDGIILNGTDKGSIGHRITDICPLSPDEYELVMEGEGYVNTGLVRLDDGTPVKVFAVAFEGVRLVMPAILKGKYASVYSLDDMSGLFGPVDERLFVTSIDNGTLLFGPLKTEAADFSGQPISVLNLDESVTREPSAGHSEVMGYGYKYRTIQYKSDIFGDVTILAAYTDDGAVPIGPLAVLLVTILLVVFLIQLYCNYIDEEPGKLQIRAGGLRPFGKKGCAVDAEKSRVLLPFSLVCIVFVTVAGFYLNSLNMIGNQIWTSQWNIRQVSENLGKIDKKLSDNFEAASEDVAAFLKVTASVLEDHQADLLNCRESSRLKEVEDKDGAVRLVEIRNPWLAGMAQAQSARDISVFDKKGRLVTTSGTQTNLGFSRDDEATASLFNVIDGVSSSEQMMDEDNFIVCAPFSLRREGKVSDAMLVTRFKIDPAKWNSTLESIRSTFNAASESGHCHYLMTSADEGHKVVYSAKVLGNIAANLSDTAYKDGYLGFHKVGNTRYCVATKQVSGNKGEYFIMSFVPLGDVYLGRTASCIGTFAVTLLIVLVFLGILLIYGPGKVARLKEAACKEMEERKSMTAIQLERMNVEMNKVPTSSQRILGVMGKIWIVILAFISLSLVIGLSTGPSETLSGYLMSFLWQRGVNIFSLTTMIVITLSFAFCMFILARIMSVLKSALNAGAETVCQLLVSLLRYAGYISVVFVTLYMFGVDTTGVLASLGAFSVMVGLGAKNLITDILAGVSIIMENDYKVGDIVNIGGFCGKVTNIGIRTTKVEDIDGNVKIFYNSGVSGVVNMTSRLSAVRMDVKLSSQHSFDEAENAFGRFFERIMNKYPQIKGECNFLGVQDSTPSFNVFRISVPCDEIDRAPLRRVLIKEFSLFCEEEKINKL